MSAPDFKCGTRFFRNQGEHDLWRKIRAVSFTEWYGASQAGGSLTDNRYISNASAALFPDFYHELRTTEGQVVGYLQTVPGYWTGHADSLQNFNHVHQTLNLRIRERLSATLAYLVLNVGLRRPDLFERYADKFRTRQQGKANAVFLLSIMVAPEFRKHHLPNHMLSAAKAAALRLGYSYVAAPFRPSHYGEYKAERRATHSEALFAEYCACLNENGLPRDPWWRNVVRQGARLVKPEPRSLSYTRSIAEFESFRSRHRPADWYSPATDVWECGETCTWYIDRVQGSVTSWEPNYWGVFELQPAVAPLAIAHATASGVNDLATPALPTS